MTAAEDALDRRRTSFGAAAADYAAGRPPYPTEAVRWCVPQDARKVVELGAGTGILTRSLLDLDLDVVAVEPIEQMRALLPPAARAVAGTAEAIPVPDGSADAVLAGQAWHWFDRDKALAEAARVLRPGGTLAVLWNLFDGSDPLTRRLGDLMDRDPHFPPDDTAPTPPWQGDTGIGDPELRIVRHRVDYDAGRIVAYSRSTSWVITMPPEERESLLTRLARSAPTGTFPLALRCQAWRGTRAR